MPKSQHETAAHDTGIPFAAEAFGDRAYQADGSLVTRVHEGSLLQDPEAVAARVVRMVTEKTVETAQGQVIAIRADSICVHGDNPAARPILEAVRRALAEAGVRVSPTREVLSP